MKKKLLVAIMFLMGLSKLALAADTYTLDKVHSQIGFSVKHLLVAQTKGQFMDYEGTIQFDANDPTAFSADVVLQANSINTNNSDRDNHLKSPDFLDADAYPTMTFKSKSLVEGTLTGDLTMHGVTKEVTIPVTISGPVNMPSVAGGGQAIGLSGETTINRQDFGVSFNKTMDQGGLMVDNLVKIMIDIEAHKK